MTPTTVHLAPWGGGGRPMLSTVAHAPVKPQLGLGWAMPGVYTTLELGPHFHATAMVHPDTYLNKVVIAGAGGMLQLWNIRTA